MDTILSLKELTVQWGRQTNTIKQVNETILCGRCCPGMTGCWDQDQGLSISRQGSPLWILYFNFQHELSFPTHKYLEIFPPALSTLASFLVTKEKKITRWRATETWKIEPPCSQSYFPFHLPFDTFYFIAFKPGLIFPGPRPMLICMAILYTGQIHEASRPGWIHKQSHIHQVAQSSIYSLWKNGG